MERFGSHQLADLVGYESKRVLDERQAKPFVDNASASAEIKRSIESSIQSIIATVRDAVQHALPQEQLVLHESRARSSQQVDEDTNEDDDLSEEDRRIQQNSDESSTGITMEETPSTSNVPRENKPSARQRPIRESMGRGGNYRDRRLGVRALSVSIQHQVAKRAEAAAQLHDTPS
ncbi:unnamed protein product [Phytophthora fragariaefolia]|uniref:Unnamed protein product n=1 Tax=Phytophthora fragariaefolia TaxID=1490495 RepID=A0A9W6XUX5_9STRA|nr:unnamed protein product [Phytophthora fragariaefolia]